MTRDEEAARHHCIGQGCGLCQQFIYGWRTGIEHERKRSQMLVEALEKIIDFEKRSDFNRSLLEVSALAKQALNDSANTPEKTLVDKNSYKKENK